MILGKKLATQAIALAIFTCLVAESSQTWNLLSQIEEYTHPLPWIKNRYVQMVNAKDGVLKMFAEKPNFLQGFSFDNLFGQGKPEQTNGLPYVTCNDKAPHWYKFFGTEFAHFTHSNQTVHTNSPCFQNATIVAEWMADDEVKLTFDVEDKSSLLCQDHYIITTLLNFDVHSTLLAGKSQVTYKLTNSTEIELVKRNGLKIVRLCDEWIRLVPDLISTMTLFTTEITTMMNINLPWPITPIVNYQNQKMLQDFLPAKFEAFKPKHKLFGSDLKKYVKSGDVICCQSASGMGGLIIAATGGPVDHSAIAMWENDQLYVVQASTNLQRVDFDDFVETGCQDGMVWLPLSDANRKKFDVNKAWAWFQNGIEGLPYGFDNLFYTWIDTRNSNFPLVVDENDWILLWSLMEKIDSKVTDTFMTNGINNRLGTKGQTFAELIVEAAKRDLSIGQVVAMPELDSYMYPNGPSYVCSCLVAAILRAGGIFDGLEINPHEFTPKDIFMLNIYSDKPDLPQKCMENDPGLPYCQVRGNFKITKDWTNRVYNSIPLYSGMNNSCAGLSPDFERADKC